MIKLLKLLSECEFIFFILLILMSRRSLLYIFCSFFPLLWCLSSHYVRIRNLLYILRCFLIFLIDPSLRFFFYWFLMISKCCFPLAYTLLYGLIKPVFITIRRLFSIKQFHFITLKIYVFFCIIIRIEAITFELFILLCLHFFAFRLVPIILKLLNTFETNIEVKTLNIFSSVKDSLSLFRSLVKGRTKLAITFFVLIVEFFPKGLWLRHVKVKTIHCFHKFFLLLFSLGRFYYG